MARIFVYDNRQFPDPDPKLSVEEVRRQFAEFFPELANAETREEKRGEDTVYTFSKRIGTKGKRKSSDIVAILRSVPEKHLRVFELASELIDEHGEVDGYVRATRQATEALAKLHLR